MTERNKFTMENFDMKSLSITQVPLRPEQQFYNESKVFPSPPIKQNNLQNLQRLP